MKQLIILTPSPVNSGSQWRLHRFTNDYSDIHNIGKCETLQFDLPRRSLISFPAPGNYNNYPSRGALYNRKISDWIISSGYTHRPSAGEKPNRLLFELTITGNTHYYRFIGKVVDYRKLQ